ncbi:oxidoreductase [Penicillium brevicompactum]|uniref:Oxidoreductase n=1 Tax=Penicillium brevicompactum TaxID=5074 RepID=A0A9W9QJT2_PENBR|nr:oxidoreductase [Penicillium brevicompactum]
MAAQIAWIGLGNMGRGMAKNLAAKGPLTSPLIIFNRNAKRAHDFASQHANTIVATSIKEAITKADIIFTCVSDDAAILDIISSGTNSGDIKGKLFVDLSTVHPDTTTTIASKIQEFGGRFVASPVFGAPAMAEAGKVICVLAGPNEAVEQVVPYTTGVIAKSFLDFSGQIPAKASQLKIMGNTFVISMVETIAEGLVVAEKSGLGTDAMHQFFEAVFPGPYVAYSNRMRSGDYHKRPEPLFSVDLVRKDARHALDMARTSGATMKGVELADHYLAQVKDRMGEKGDLAGIYGAIREESGLEFMN